MANKKVRATILLKGKRLVKLQSREQMEKAEAVFQTLEKQFPVRIALRGRMLQIKGQKDVVEEVKGILQKILSETNGSLPSLIAKTISSLSPKTRFSVDPVLFRTMHGKEIGPVNSRQRAYLKTMEENDFVFVEGPAGTGKTYLAVGYGCFLLKERKVSRLILTRPAREAGERLGYLPGDIQAKIEPYFRPIYDALFEMIETESYGRFIERDIIEVAPLAYMRGRTLNDAFIILDEAQNTTPEQMKMFLTRLGRDSSAVITGDTTQIDIADGRPSGLVEAMRILKDIPNIGFVSFTKEDVIRHPLVQAVVEAYEKEALGTKAARE